MLGRMGRVLSGELGCVLAILRRRTAARQRGIFTPPANPPPVSRRREAGSPGGALLGDVDVVVLPRVLDEGVLLVAVDPWSHERVLDAPHAEVPWIVGVHELGHLRVHPGALRTGGYALRLAI